MRPPPVASGGDQESKPPRGPEYLEWLDRKWPGDIRELREGRYLHQQGDLRLAFERSDYWRDVSRRLGEWAHEFNQETGVLLFQGAPVLPVLDNKSWQSFLSRTWRENVRNNARWPEPPDGGWWLPDNWFERAWDIVRTRFVVRYLDGVKRLAERLVSCAHEFSLDAEHEPQAKAGYYAFHVQVRQAFAVDALDYQGRLDRSSVIEIQVMTDLAEVISQLTHTWYELRRESDYDRIPLEWDYTSDEFTSAFLGDELHALEARVMQLRDKIRETTPNGESAEATRSRG